MLIRSQDKKILVNLEQCSYLKIKADIYCEGFITPNFDCYKISTSDFDLGEYSSEAKASKVLDMIHLDYELSCYCDSAFDTAARTKRPYIFVNNRIFQIPQDLEVEE